MYLGCGAFVFVFGYEPKILSQDWVLSGGVVWTASSVYLGRGAIKCLVNNLHHVMPLQNNLRLKDIPQNNKA